MNHIQFVEAGLHNRHIQFRMGGGVLTGVITDDKFHTEGKTKATHYTYVPTQNMKEWKEAEKAKDRKRMNALSKVVDIEEISWGEQIIPEVSRH